MAEVLIGLGSNVGDAKAYLLESIAKLSGVVRDLRVSSMYETAPMYITDQPNFVNAAAAGRFTGGPLSLFYTLKAIEARMGRTERGRNGPREIDLDLLAYGAVRYAFRTGGREVLRVPHPRMAERRFVLEPLSEIFPNFEVPGLGAVREALKATDPQARDVSRLQDHVLSIPSAG